MATGMCHFALLFAFSLPNLQAFSQQKIYAHLNLITSTIPVLNYLSQTNTSSNFFQSNSKLNLSIVSGLSTDCGQGGSAYNPPASPSTEPGGSEVSPNTVVLNPQLAYDADENSYSTIYMDEQQKGVELAQYILFNNPGSATDQVRLKMSLTGDLLNDNDYTVTLQGFMGTTAVGTIVPITTGLTTNQLQYYITPGAIFDRIKINILTNTNGSKKAQVNVHYVTLNTPPTPSLPGTTVTAGVSSSSESHCEGPVTLTVSSPDAAYIYKWYDSSNNLVTTGTSYSSSLNPGTYTYYVSASRGPTCPESAKHTINLTVFDTPDAPNVNPN